MPRQGLQRPQHPGQRPLGQGQFLERAGFLARKSCQFHWTNAGYSSAIRFWKAAVCDRRGAKLGDRPVRMLKHSDVLTAIAPRGVFVMAPLHDSNFDVDGVRDVLKVVTPVYEKLKAGDKLKAIHPDAKHEWPADARTEAYEFVDKVLK